MKSRFVLTLPATVGCICFTATEACASTIIIAESFGGLLGDNLSSEEPDTFAPAITTAGGSSTWVQRGTDFRANGSVVGDDTGTSRSGSAYLNLGTYINEAKGTESGKFVLQATVSTTAGAWLALGFASETTPNVERNFTNSSGGTGSTTGYGNMIVRLNGDIDQFNGPASQLHFQNRMEGGPGLDGCLGTPPL